MGWDENEVENGARTTASTQSKNNIENAGRPGSQVKQNIENGDGSGRKSTNPPGTVYGGGGGGGSSSSGLDHIRSYPSGGMTPSNDGTYGHPSDMQLEQAANNAAIAAKNAKTIMDKYNNAMTIYDESDKGIEAIVDAKVRDAKHQNWQAQQQRQLAALQALANNSGTGQSGSYWKNVMQAYALVDDMADVAVIDQRKKNINEAYAEEAEAKQQNQNSRNELGLETQGSLDSLLADYAAQMSSLYPGFASGIYGSEQQKSWDESTPEDERPSQFTYLTQNDIDNELEPGSEDLSLSAKLAESNQNAENYDFAPIIDREGRTINAPYWWPAFQFEVQKAINPRTADMVRGADDVTATALMGNTGETSKGSAATKYKNLEPYLTGYQNRSTK